MATSRVDRNQQEIVQALKRVGAEILYLHTLRHGAPDLLVCFRRQLFLMEIKAGKAKLTPDEETFHHRWPVAIVRSVGDALTLLGIAA